MTQEIMEWLKNGNGVLALTKNNMAYFYIKVPYNGNFDFIYTQMNYHGNNIKAENFEYAGIYNKTDGKIYNVHYMFPTNGIEHEIGISYEVFTKTFKDEINAKINEIIDNDRNKLTIKDESELTEDVYKRNLENAREYRETQKVRSLFLSGKTPADVVFNAGYSNTNHTKDTYIAYLTDKTDLIKTYAEEWIAKNQERIYADFLINDIIAEELQKTIDDKTYEIHTVRTIINSLKNVDCKTVNVTVKINDIEFTFKTEVRRLKMDCQYSYSTYEIAAQDRGKFKELYGRHTDYRPNDITKITYGKKTLYEKTINKYLNGGN